MPASIQKNFPHCFKGQKKKQRKRVKKATSSVSQDVSPKLRVGPPTQKNYEEISPDFSSVTTETSTLVVESSKGSSQKASPLKSPPIQRRLHGAVPPPSKAAVSPDGSLDSAGEYQHRGKKRLLTTEDEEFPPWAKRKRLKTGSSTMATPQMANNLRSKINELANAKKELEEKLSKIQQEKEVALQEKEMERRAKEVALHEKETERRAKEVALQEKETERREKEVALQEQKDELTEYYSKLHETSVNKIIEDINQYKAEFKQERERLIHVADKDKALAGDYQAKFRASQSTLRKFWGAYEAAKKANKK